jgi:hypothetical protein
MPMPLSIGPLARCGVLATAERQMAGGRLTWVQIASVIINKRTGKPISLDTLGRVFKD